MNRALSSLGLVSFGFVTVIFASCSSEPEPAAPVNRPRMLPGCENAGEAGVDRSKTALGPDAGT
ncbi:MAG TPA: hypothetical protein VK524_25695 [Polyangiaceae bacterium]|nr:hypothetical protein [Polyangiaceae bacterium]